jgi:uncharacterized membrane protein (DUF485 family)
VGAEWEMSMRYMVVVVASYFLYIVCAALYKDFIGVYPWSPKEPYHGLIAYVSVFITLSLVMEIVIFKRKRKYDRKR